MPQNSLIAETRFKSISPARIEIQRTAQIYLERRQDLMKIHSTSSFPLSKSPARRVSPLSHE